MREIKFRAWDKSYNEMEYDIISVGRKRIIGESACETFEEVLNSWEYEVMQYTGVKDKNGKEIYEGDIIRTNEGHNEKIVFDEASFKCVWLHNNHLVNSILDNLFIRMCEPIVIGNIYENPELFS